MIVGVGGFIQNLIEFGIGIAAAVQSFRRSRYFRGREQVVIKDRILISADPLTIVHLKLTILDLLAHGVEFGCFNRYRNTDVLQIVLNDSRVLACGGAAARNTK